MTKELYEQLTPKEKAMYDELFAFSKRLATRVEEVISLLNTIIAMGNE